MTKLQLKTDPKAPRRPPHPTPPPTKSAAAVKAAGRAESPAIDLGRTARRLRESQNLTLADVAGRANISSAMLSRLETGRVSPSLETIVALSQALGVTASVLMQRVGADDGGAQLIRAGEGLETVRSGTRRGHTYHLLAAQRGPRKVFEPFSDQQLDEMLLPYPDHLHLSIKGNQVYADAILPYVEEFVNRVLAQHQTTSNKTAA